MHLIGIRKSVAEEYPDLPRALYDAFVQSRDMAMERLRSVWLGNANRMTLPWLNSAMERTLASMGPDYWSYGCTANMAEINAICRYSLDQHLSAGPVAPEALFHPSVLDT
jgi:4,5-dihydroxyphthalate decarboxylase